jgi:hypothetical protein
MAPKSSKPRNETWILLPAETEGWELWSDLGGGVFSKTAEASSPAELNWKGPATLAVPVRQVFATPIRLAGADASTRSDMVRLELERQGIPSESDPHLEEVGSDESGERLLALTLNPNLPETWINTPVDAFDTSARLLSLPPSQISLWLELGRVSMAVRNETRMVYCQSLTSLDVEGLRQELETILLQLEASSLLEGVHGMTCLGTWDEELLRGLSGVHHLALYHLERPAPMRMPAAPALTPPEIKNRKARQEKSLRNMRIMAGAAVVYLVLVLAWLGWLGSMRVKINSERAWLQARQSQIDEVKAATARWTAIESSVFPDRYPIEVLFRLTELLPAEGVRFTSFNISNGNVLARGEARNVQDAFSYMEKVKGTDKLGGFSWNMPQPNPLPNGNYSFQMDGTPQ